MSDDSSHIFIARQPIFDTDKKVKAYELLFRSGMKNSFDPSINQDFASKKMMSDAIHLWGMDQLIGSHKAFVNLTESVLLSDIPFLFDKNRVVIELLETIEPTNAVIDRCRELKSKGYVLALDDFVFESRFTPLFEFVDIIKIDFILSHLAERSQIVEQIKGYNIKLLAEKVETLDEFKSGKDLGYGLFQGYFFSKPEMLSGRDIPANKLSMMQILKQVNQPDLDFKGLNDLISRDVSLSYKLMRFINSVSFGLKKEVKSIRHALVLLGENEVRKWVSLIALSSMGEDKPLELLVLSLCRGIFLEKMAEKIGIPNKKSDLFLAGLFSMIDGFLDRPMAELLTNLPISEAIRNVLCGKESEFSALFKLMLAYEKGRWEEFSQAALALKVPESEIPGIYQEALKGALKVQGD